MIPLKLKHVNKNVSVQHTEAAGSITWGARGYTVYVGLSRPASDPTEVATCTTGLDDVLHRATTPTEAETVFLDCGALGFAFFSDPFLLPEDDSAFK